MEKVLFESNARQDLKMFVSLAKKVGISVRYIRNDGSFPKINKRKMVNSQREMEIINRNADYLNSEAQDVLSYQVF